MGNFHDSIIHFLGRMKINSSVFKTMQDKSVQEHLKSGMSWLKMWLTFGQERYNYDENFLGVSNYVKEIQFYENSKNVILFTILYQINIFLIKIA